MPSASPTPEPPAPRVETPEPTELVKIEQKEVKTEPSVKPEVTEAKEATEVKDVKDEPKKDPSSDLADLLPAATLLPLGTLDNVELPESSICMCRIRNTLVGIERLIPQRGRAKAKKGMKIANRVEARCGFDLCALHGLGALSEEKRKEFEALREAATQKEAFTPASTFFEDNWIVQNDDEDVSQTLSPERIIPLEDEKEGGRKRKAEGDEGSHKKRRYSEPDSILALERHVGEEVLLYTDECVASLPDPCVPPDMLFRHDEAGLAKVASISNKTVLLIVELRSADLRTACYIGRGVMGGPYCMSSGVETLCVTFSSRLELLLKVHRCLAGLRGKGNAVWICLVTHASSSGQTFSCTPKEIIRDSSLVEENISTAEEFCSVADFCKIISDTIPAEEVIGVHLSACTSMRFRKKQHDTFPVASNWYDTNRLCLTGYSNALHTTDGCFIAASLASLIAAQKVRCDKGYAEIFQIFKQILAKDVAEGCSMTMVTPGTRPRPEGRAVSHKTRAAKLAHNNQRARTDVLIYLAHDVCRVIRNIVVALQHAVSIRTDTGGSVITIKELSKEEDIPATILANYKNAKSEGQVLMLASGGGVAGAALNELTSELEAAGYPERFVMLGAGSPLHAWVLPHACTRCCEESGVSSPPPAINYQQPRDQTGLSCEGSCTCAGRHALLFGSLLWSLLLLCGEGWSLQEVQEELCINAPGFVI